MATGRQALSRPALRISRAVDRDGSDKFTSQVWSPFTATYQPVASVAEGLHRLNELAGLIGQMWVLGHPRLAALTDVPSAPSEDRGEWAELRVNATSYRAYDTRWHGRPAWTVASGLLDAVESTCARIGCPPPRVN